MNVQLWFTGYFMLSLVEILDIKYLNNIVEQSHRWVKPKTRQALGWKSTEGALASLHGRELKQDQIDVEGQTAFERFYALAASLYLSDWTVTPLTRFATEPLISVYQSHSRVV